MNTPAAILNECKLCDCSAKKLRRGVPETWRAQKTGPRLAGLFKLTRSPTVTVPAVVTPTMVMPPMVMPTMVVPTHFGRVLLRTLLDRRGGGGIGQRQRLNPLSRSGKEQNRTNCSEPQNPRHLH
jgi:hypothetical protein